MYWLWCDGRARFYGEICARSERGLVCCLICGHCQKQTKPWPSAQADWTHVVSNHDGFSRNQSLRYQSGNDDRLLFHFVRGSDRGPLFIKPCTALLLQRDCNSISENCITHGVTLPVNSIQFDAQTYRREKEHTTTLHLSSVLAINHQLYLC